MLRNYLIIALRNLWKHKIFTAVNVFGLAIAFGAALLLSLTAFHELSYDKFHLDGDRTFQLYRQQFGLNESPQVSFPVPLMPALKTEFPDIAMATRLGQDYGIIRYNGRQFDLGITEVDPDFLRMFSFPLLKGDAGYALGDPNNIVLSASTARIIFGSGDPVGHTVQIRDNTGNWSPFVVSAVAADAPDNSSIEFQILRRFENFAHYKQDIDNWTQSNHSVFIQLKPSVSPQNLETKLKPFVHKYYDSAIAQLKRGGGAPDKEGEFMRIRMIPLRDIHFSSASNLASTNKFYPILLLVISCFILFIASVNFVNLSLGRAFTRAREIGMRKVLGARRRQILLQFWGEAFIVCLASLALGALLASTALPAYKTLFNQHISKEILGSAPFLIALTTGFILVSLIAGGYPAAVLARLNASQTVKGVAAVSYNQRVRNGLMVTQFVISGLLIICTTIVWQQLSYVRNLPLGFDKAQVLSIPIGNQIDGETALQQMRVRLASLPNMVSVTGSDMNMGRGRDNSSSTSIMTFDYKGRTIRTHIMRVDFDYARTLGLQIASGRDFSTSYGLDSGVVVVNEKMAAALGEKDPLTATVNMDDIKLPVVGVVKDFHFKSLHQQIEPLTMMIRKEWPLSYIFVRVQPHDLPASLEAVTRVWKGVNPKAETAISFLDENTDKQYRKEERLSKIFIIGAILAIIISCLGLFAIVALVMARRTREIGIRKVLGASTANIVQLVAREFLPLVIVALLIASPIAWFIMHNWLGDFAYRISLTPWVFLIPAAAAITIALATLSVQALRTAWLNPAKNLRAD